MTEFYPFPRINECIDLLRSPKLFSTVNASSANGQIEVDEDERKKTASTSYHGLYQFLSMQL